MSMTASERSLIGQVGAYAQHAKYDTRETTAKARSTFMASFLDQVDPDHVLPEAERNRRADAARTAHFKRLAFKSAQSRRIRSTRSADRVGNSTPRETQPVDAVSGADRAQRGAVGEVGTATSDAALEAGAGVASTSTTSTKQKRAGGHQRAS